jgi:hypothetical protein
MLGITTGGGMEATNDVNQADFIVVRIHVDFYNQLEMNHSKRLESFWKQNLPGPNY